MQDEHDLWVFAYGSLMWNPEFDADTVLPARATGWRRRFCMLSFHYRGTETCPGLVLALDRDPGAVCDGLALRVAADRAAGVLEALRARELVSHAYHEVALPVTLTTGQTVTALTYVIDRDHRQYCDLDRDTQAAMIATACGERGRNADYLHATAAHLVELRIDDPDILWLDARVRALCASANG